MVEQEVIELPDNKLSTLLKLCREKGIELDQDSIEECVRELELIDN